MNRAVFLVAAILAAPAAAPADNAPGAAPAASAAASAPISAAEQMLFVDPHLRSLKPPQSLVYRLQEPGTAGGSARVDFSARGDGGCCRAQARFEPADGSPPLPQIDDASANPVLLFFLEREVRGLQQRNKGQSAHFRRRIRLALAEAATIATVTVRWRGADVPATMVSITPFADDPYRARFEAEALTTYTFVLSAAVPGTVVQMRAFPAPDKPTSPPQRTLTLEGAEVDPPKPPAAASPAPPAKT